jgi:hypothetical protein
MTNTNKQEKKHSVRGSSNRSMFFLSPIGIDIWGRGTYGDGGWQTHVALSAIERSGTSVALFGGAWMYESQGGSRSRLILDLFEAKFWLGHNYHGTIHRYAAAYIVSFNTSLRFAR